MNKSAYAHNELADNETPAKSDTQGQAVHNVPRRVRSSKKGDNAFKTISEVAQELDVQQHVLRFWETKFTQIKPLKRGGGRRYYRPEDMELLKRIHHLLYTEGYTIKGVQKLIRELGKKAFVEQEAISVLEVSNQSHAEESADFAANTAQEASVKQEASFNSSQRDALKSMLAELKELKRIVNEA